MGQFWPPMPDPRAAGLVTITGNGGSTRTVAITFPAGKFATAPIVIAGSVNSAGGVPLTAMALNVTTTGCDIRLAAGTAFSSSYDVPWIAIPA
ncbi:hypothetical protein GCM10022239_03290 [Leifsonia bigeumensis]|uniref:H-type lectin domain-containing protein n=1 Tax=Leifsonella bigeumensis TaxID=433643 RepID=A0ABP7F2K8_9MICO